MIFKTFSFLMVIFFTMSGLHLSCAAAKAQFRVFFDPGHYTVMENVGTFTLTVTREGGDLTKTLCVDFKSADGTANEGSDYEHVEGTLTFQPGETHKQFSLTVIDDDISEEDEHLYVQLSNCVGAMCTLDMPFIATVMILDDDHPGIFNFEEGEMKVTDTVGMVQIKVVRSLGARGRVNVPYHPVDGTAKKGVDFTLVDDRLTFENDEME